MWKNSVQDNFRHAYDVKFPKPKGYNYREPGWVEWYAFQDRGQEWCALNCKRPWSMQHFGFSFDCKDEATMFKLACR